MSREFMAGEEGPEIDVVIPGETKPQIKPFAKDHIPGMHPMVESEKKIPAIPEPPARAPESLTPSPSGAYRTPEYDPHRTGYKIETKGHFAVAIDPLTNKEVARVPKVAGGADAMGARLFDPEWNLDILQQQADRLLARISSTEDRLLREELAPYEMQLDAYLIARDRITPLTPDGNEQFERIQREFKAIFLLNKANAALNRGVADKVVEIEAGDWSKESFEAVMEKDGVKEAVQVIEDSGGIIFWKKETWDKLNIWEKKERLDRGERILDDRGSEVSDQVQANWEKLISRVSSLGVSSEKELNEFVAKSPQDRLTGQISRQELLGIEDTQRQLQVLVDDLNDRGEPLPSALDRKYQRALEIKNIITLSVGSTDPVDIRSALDDPSHRDTLLDQLMTISNPVDDKKAADLTIKLFHFYRMSAQYSGPIENGRLIEEEIIERVFPAGAPIDMTNEKYWAEWDLFRRKRDLGLADFAGSLPYAVGRACFSPEFLKISPFVSAEASPLRKYFDPRCRSTAYSNHVRTMSELYAKRDKISFFGDAQIVKGASEMMAKVAVKGGILEKPLVEPSAVFQDAKKALPEILKPFLELSGLFTYLTYYSDRDFEIDANREPDKVKGYIFSGLMRWVNTWEAQGLTRTRTFFGLLPGKEWGRVEIYDAIDVARERGAFDLQMDNTLERAFGTSKATKVGLTVLNRVPGALVDFVVGLFNLISPIKIK